MYGSRLYVQCVLIWWLRGMQMVLSHPLQIVYFKLWDAETVQKDSMLIAYRYELLTIRIISDIKFAIGTKWMTFVPHDLSRTKVFRMFVHSFLLDLPRGLADSNQSALFSAVALQKCEKGLMFDVSLSNSFHVYFAVKHAVTLLLYYHVSFMWAFSSMHVEVTTERSTRRPTAQAVTALSRLEWYCTEKYLSCVHSDRQDLTLFFWLYGKNID